MGILDRLEQKFGKYAIKNLTYILIGGQILAYLLVYSKPMYLSFFPLEGGLLWQGQVWRLLSFIFTPPEGSILFTILSWYLLYFFGMALESRWGSFRYLVYLLVGYIAMILLSILFPTFAITNLFITLSVFLAFAYLFPEMKLYVLFIIPVKVKWLGYLAWAGVLLSILFGGVSTALITFASVINFILFFGRDIMQSSRWARKKVSQYVAVSSVEKPYHVCAVCGRNEKKDPDMQIRYCSKCVPTTCYCENHIHEHEHKRTLEQAPKKKRIVN